jgi:hypothetical protein
MRALLQSFDGGREAAGPSSEAKRGKKTYEKNTKVLGGWEGRGGQHDGDCEHFEEETKAGHEYGLPIFFGKRHRLCVLIRKRGAAEERGGLYTPRSSKHRRDGRTSPTQYHAMQDPKPKIQDDDK